MKYMDKRIILCVLSLVFFAGCFNHTIPTVKMLDQGEEMWGASFGMPIYSGSQSYDDEIDSDSPNIFKQFSWSLWYGNGVNNYSDYYAYIGELGGIGVLVNSEVRHSGVSSVVLNYGIGTSNGIYGFRPIMGINYSEGKYKDKENANGDIIGHEKKLWKQIGFLTGISYEVEGDTYNLTGDYQLYVGLDNKKEDHFYFGRVSMQKVNEFAYKFSEFSKWAPEFLSYREWAKTPYHFNLEAGMGSIK